MDKEYMLPIDTTLNGGRYQVIEQLSSGGFGNTYKVEEVFKKKVYAMKEFFIRTINERDADGKTVKVSNKDNIDTFIHQKEKFKVEAERLRDINDSNIVKVYDFFPDNETFYYVMDFIEGRSLDKRDEPLHEKEAWHVLDQILNALSCIHQVKTFEDGKERIWVHLDISPSNLMIDDQRHITLIDFGSSKQLSVSDAPSISHISQLAFKKGYSPLEQTSQRFDSIGPWTDFYALGATLYNLQTSTDTQIPEYSELQDKINDGVDLAQAFHFPQDMSEKMRKLIVWMMNPNRKERPQSVSDIRSYLKPDNEFTGFKHILTIETDPVGCGIVSVNPEKGQYDDGDSIVCEAKPQNGCQFQGWYNSQGEQVGNDAIFSFEIDNNTRLIARFNQCKKPSLFLYALFLCAIILLLFIIIPRPDSHKEDDITYNDNVVSVKVKKNEEGNGIKRTIQKIAPEEIKYINGNFSDGLVCVCNKEGKYGFIDNKYNIIIPFIYDYALNFSEGLAAVKRFTSNQGEWHQEWGYIDTDGDTIIDFKQRDLAFDFHDGRSIIFTPNRKWMIINKRGESVVPPTSSLNPCDPRRGFIEGMLKIQKKDFVGFIDITGNESVPCSYWGASDYSEGLAVVSLVKDTFEDNKAFIDKKGNILLGPFFEAYPFSEGLASVWNNGHKFINKKGETVLEFERDLMVDNYFSEGLVQYSIENEGESVWEKGYINKNGKKVIIFSYNGEDSYNNMTLYSFSDGLAKICKDHLWGYINKRGKIQIDCIYDDASDYQDGYALVTKNGHQFLIDKDGNNIFNVKKEL